LGKNLADGKETHNLKKAISLFSELVKEMKLSAQRKSSEFYVVLFSK
jgi:hypothetical protein